MSNYEKSITQADVKKTYRFYAPIYDLLFGAVLEPGRKAISKEVTTLNPKKILEIGVGTGLLLYKYPQTTEITGIDISEEMLSIARERVQHLPNKSNVTLLAMDAENLDFADKSFDCVVLPYVLSVTPNPNNLIKEMQRVCTNNGTMMIVNHFSGSGTWYLLEKMVKNVANKIGFQSDFSYEENIEKHKLNVVKNQTVNLFGLSKFLVIKNN